MTFLKKQWPALLSIVIGLSAITFFLILFNLRVERHEETIVQNYLEEIRDNATFMLRSEIHQFVTTIQNEARTFSLLGSLSEEEIIRELHDFSADSSMLRVYILTTEGRAFSNQSKSAQQYSAEYYAQALLDLSSGLSKPRYSTSLDKMVVEISAPLYIDGAYYGLLVGCYDLNFFEDLLLNNFLKGDCAISVATADGTLLLQSDPHAALVDYRSNIFEFYSLQGIGFTENSVAQLRQDLQTGASGYAAYHYGDSMRYFSYAPVGIDDWYLSTVATEKTMEEQTAEITGYAMFLISGVSLAVIFIAIVILLSYSKGHAETQIVLQKMATRDALTGLYNRSAIEERIGTYLSGPGQAGRHALFMFDIDGFKMVNDRLGHIKGDELLAEFSALLKMVFPSQAILGRIGGDEFMALLPNVSTTEDITAISVAICQGFRKTHGDAQGCGQTAATSASIGIAIYGQDGDSFHSLYRAADTALYVSKNNGRDQYSFYASSNFSK